MSIFYHDVFYQQLPLPYLKVGYLTAPPAKDPIAPHKEWERSQFVLNHEGLQQVRWLLLISINTLVMTMWSLFEFLHIFFFVDWKPLVCFILQNIGYKVYDLFLMIWLSYIEAIRLQSFIKGRYPMSISCLRYYSIICVCVYFCCPP